MPEDTLDVEHITDLAEKAEVIAEATNRRAEDVLADLLDDGQANMSAGIDAQRPESTRASRETQKFAYNFNTNNSNAWWCCRRRFRCFRPNLVG